MLEGDILTREEFGSMVRSRLHFSEQTMNDWEQSRGEAALQINVACANHMRCMWLNIPEESLAYFRGMDPMQTAVLGAVWEKELKEKIASGNPEI